MKMYTQLFAKLAAYLVSNITICSYYLTKIQMIRLEVPYRQCEFKVQMLDTLA